MPERDELNPINHKQQPLVSVIIPTYNRIGFLEDAVESVLKQTYSNLELIVVDDGSTDQTKEYIGQHSNQLCYVCQDNKGVAAARNRGILEASGSLIAFLDSDDRFERKKLEIQVAAMLGDPSCLVSHTQEKWFRRGQFLNQKKKHRKESGYLFTRCLELCAVGMSTVMVKRELFDTVGSFDENLPCCEDYDLWLRTSVALPFLLIDMPLTIKNGGRPDQLSVKYRVGMDAYRIQSIIKLIESSMLNAKQLKEASCELITKCNILANGCLKHGKLDEAQYFTGLITKYSP